MNPTNKLLVQAGSDADAVHCPHLYWGAGIDAAVKRAAHIAEDHTYTFKTPEQRYNPACALPYGPARQTA